MAPVIAALLAISMAIFPISMAGAATLGDHAHATSPVRLHPDVEPDASAARAALHCGDHDTGKQAVPGRKCCGASACHAFQVGVEPGLPTPLARIVCVGIGGDRQVRDVSPDGLERPPRSA